MADRAIELGKFQSGRMAILCDPPLEWRVARAILYVGQQLLVLEYVGGEDELMEYQLSGAAVAELLAATEDVIVVEKDEAGLLHGYDVSLEVVHD